MIMLKEIQRDTPIPAASHWFSFLLMILMFILVFRCLCDQVPDLLSPSNCKRCLRSGSVIITIFLFYVLQKWVFLCYT